MADSDPRWAVCLGGAYTPYDADVSAQIEVAHRRGDATARICVRGAQYDIVFAEMKQRAAHDPTRSRAVRRTTESHAGLAGAGGAQGENSPIATPPSKKHARDESAAGSAGAPSSPHTTLLFAPGAGGKTAQAMRRLHADLERAGIIVHRCDDRPGFKWNTSSPGARKNVDAVLAAAAEASAARPDLPLVLCGASFGCRVLATLLRTRAAELPPRVTDALVCCGYPLHKPGAAEGFQPERANALAEMPNATRVLLVQGSLDEFNGPRGICALREVVARMVDPGRVQLLEVPNGQHTVPEVTRVKELGLTRAAAEEQAARLVRDAIAAFVVAAPSDMCVHSSSKRRSRA